jgi:hypothetical protein
MDAAASSGMPIFWIGEEAVGDAEAPALPELFDNGDSADMAMALRLLLIYKHTNNLAQIKNNT